MAVRTSSPAGAADDAQQALWHALALHDASPARYAAVADTLILQLAGDPQTGAGRYTVSVYHRGRDGTAQAEDEIHHVMGAQGDDKQIEALQARYGAHSSRL